MANNICNRFNILYRTECRRTDITDDVLDEYLVVIRWQLKIELACDQPIVDTHNLKMSLFERNIENFIVGFTMFLEVFQQHKES